MDFMMRIELQDASRTMVMRIQGSFVGKFAEHARELITRCRVLPKLVVDLSEVSFIDSTGEEVLAWFGQLGAMFVAKNYHSQHVCERLRLPMAASLPRHIRKRACGQLRQASANGVYAALGKV
jgi:hypothetical protein